MTSAAILKCAIHGTRIYKEYLNQSGNSKHTVSVNKITKRRSGQTFSLYLSKKLFGLDELEFFVSKKRYTSEQIKVESYDPIKKILVVAPSVDYNNVFLGVNAEDIFVITNSLSLVLNFENWFVKQKSEGWLPSLPQHEPIILFDDETEIEHSDVSEEQLKAIKTSLTSPLSYIWGAPGTGKTKYVLAQCVTRYICEDNVVLISAPTNAALDQTLFGVMEILEKKGMQTKDVIRLGVPSEKFCKKYPESCEEAGVTFALEALRREKKALSKDLQIIENLTQYLAQVKGSIEKIEIVKNLLSSCVENNNKRNNQLNELEAIIASLENDIRKKRSEQAKAKANFENLAKKRQKFKFLFCELFKLSYYFETEKEYRAEETKLSELETCIKEIDIELTNHRNDYAVILEKAKKKTEEQNILDFVKEVFLFEGECFDDIISLAEELIADVDMISDFIEKTESELYELQDKFSEMIFEKRGSDFKNGVLQNELDELNNKIELLRKSAVDERIAKAKVIAVTADGFVSRYDLIANRKKDISHVFIDEAGYCSLVKSLPLMSLDCPVTLLGDHMQLPPVSEIQDSKKDEEKHTSFVDALFWTLPATYCEDVYSYSLDELYDKYIDHQPPDFVRLKMCVLNTTFRFGGKLATILGKFVYTEDFKSSKKKNSTEIVVIDAKKHPGEKERTNAAEVVKIKEFVSTNELDDYVILSPYKNQNKLLYQQIPKIYTDNGERIKTVHASQGQEWDTVILSVVDRGRMYFVNSKLMIGKAVINTAISRARKRLVIVCDYTHWSSLVNQLITELIDCADEVHIDN